ncbi:TonB-linked outer membrane protein, SusC/RagA family [Chitinophaga rupis]|uniref:TonB-linked outer membrane protein, SusC/RagA family n=2 Tax=Chitinophaga rupis TaxID=573321 RepID=A0A1H7P9Z3_9BACT|nr:TonB-linked outer membrane protein, SusC/RagA family [Chitinophaga rupis]
MHFKTFCNREVIAMPVGSNNRLSGDDNLKDNRRLRTLTLRVMKLSTIILLAACLQVSASSYSQTVTYTCRNESLVNVFKAIKQQTGYVVFYDQGMVDTLQGVTLNAKEQPLKSFMNEALQDLPLSYTFKDRTIVISKKSVINQLLDRAAQEKPQYIFGRLLDEESQPIENASLTLQPLGLHVVTDAAGSFSFGEVPPGNYTLVITHISYSKLEKKIKVKGETVDLRLVMYKQRFELGPVEVSVASTGYQKINRYTSTGSYTLITAKEIDANPSINLAERLEGKVPGVHFDLANNRIQIRGANNFATGKDRNVSTPLIVIDGFPAIEQNLANYPGSPLGEGAVSPNSRSGIPISNATILSIFNPADIQSITFLKDAAAASIWGSRAANGVIVIETKKGVKGRTSVTASSTISVSSTPDMSKANMMNSAQYVDFEKELYEKGYFKSDPTTNWRYPNVDDAALAMYAAQRGDITSTQLDAKLQELSQRNNSSQLRKYLMQQAVTQQYNLSLSGGAGNTSYYISGNYSANSPVFKNNSSKNYLLLANLTNDFFNRRLTITTGLNQVYSDRMVNNAAQTAMSPGNLGLRPYDMLVDEQGKPINRAIDYMPHVVDSLTKLGMIPWTYSPFEELQSSNIYKTTATRLTSQIRGKITDWLELDFSGMYQRNLVDMSNLQKQNSYVVKSLINTGTSFTNGKPVYGVPLGGIMYTSHTATEDYSLRGQLSIDKRFYEKHQFNMIAGTEIRQSTGSGYSQGHFGFDEDTYNAVSVNPTTPYKTFYGSTATIGAQQSNIQVNKARYLSYYGNASYTYNYRYTASGSLRFDDHNLVGVERRNRAKPLWSAGLKWDLKRESFLENVRWVNGLDVRASLGTGGTIPMSATPFAIISLVAPDGITQAQPGAYVGLPANRDLSWETTRTLNFGTDATLFAGRLMVTMDIYNKHSYGILSSLPINPTYGWDFLSYNAADMRSHGVEFSVSGDVLRSRDWNWNASFNITYSTNKVTDNRFPNKTTSPSGSPVVATGYPTDNLFVYRWAGLDNQGQSQIYDRNGKIIPSSETTDFTPEDLLYAGRTTAPWFGGFSQNLRWKQFSLGMQLSYYMGYKVLKNDINISNYPTGSESSGFLTTSKTLVNRWRKPGDEAFTNVPGLMNFNGTSIQRYMTSSVNVIDGDHIRLQMVSLGYTLPNAVLNRIKVMKSLSVRASANNLGIIWRKNKEHIDPDYMFSGAYTSWPPVRNYSFNVNVTF